MNNTLKILLIWRVSGQSNYVNKPVKGIDTKIVNNKNMILNSIYSLPSVIIIVNYKTKF